MNSDVIHLLPDSVANQIAAGEVIQRPASVIKELVENSVDAGATKIQIVIKDAGRTLIQVIDNGKGMSPTDARMAFERHATSKIREAGDLYSLRTMGFRGEALPSIAAVSQIELKTMRPGDTIGTALRVSESKFESQEPCVCTSGTNLSVRNIFYNMPARRRFLKSDRVEFGHILREFERMALVNTDIEFILSHNDVTLHSFLPGSFKQRIGSLFGKTLETQIASINTETSLVQISGFIGLPRFAKRTGAHQFFFVNGRHMRHPLFHRAVIRCYEQLISGGTQPSYFINLLVEPESIDVNIHPQKHEIKFEHEQAIVQILEATIKETLGKAQAGGALDFDIEDSPDIPLFNPVNSVEAPSIKVDESFNPFAEGESSDRVMQGLRAASWENRPGISSRSDWEKLYENFSSKRDETVGALRASQLNSNDNPTLSSFGELENVFEETVATNCLHLAEGFIATDTRKGLMLVHQRRAHIRILYEQIMARMASRSLDSQKLLFAEDIELPPNQGAMLVALGSHISDLGFEVSHNGGALWTIEAAPALLGTASASEALQAVLGEMPEDYNGGESFQSPAALSLARSSAIARNATLSVAEMDSILADLFRCQQPGITPDGLMVYKYLSREDLDKMFS